MSYQLSTAGGPVESVCQYEGSNRLFRGPERSLDSAYVACLGGEMTFGRFVDQPFPAVLERKLDRRCVNLGSLFCGAEALSQDDGVLDLVNGSDLCILQLPDILGQSNGFFRVHPRRNDRFVAPSEDLKSLYPEADFTDIHFVRHLVSRLNSYSDARFDFVAQEISRSWIEKVSSFLAKVVPPVILLWLEMETDLDGPGSNDPIRVEPNMIEGLKPLCAETVSMKVRRSGESDELEDMLFGTLQQPIADHMIGPATHRKIAETLVRVVRDMQ